MGVHNTELYNNLGLCCFYAQQYDMTLTCFERALSLATDENMADVWYNIGHVALVSNKKKLSEKETKKIKEIHELQFFFLYISNKVLILSPLFPRLSFRA